MGFQNERIMFLKRLFFKCKTHTLLPIKIWTNNNNNSVCMKIKCITCYDEELLVVPKEHPMYNYWLGMLESNKEYEDFFKSNEAEKCGLKPLETGTGIRRFWSGGNMGMNVFNYHKWQLKNEVILLLLIVFIWIIVSTSGCVELAEQTEDWIKNP